jgi:hypothetical protein
LPKRETQRHGFMTQLVFKWFIMNALIKRSLFPSHPLPGVRFSNSFTINHLKTNWDRNGKSVMTGVSTRKDREPSNTDRPATNL